MDEPPTVAAGSDVRLDSIARRLAEIDSTPIHLRDRAAVPEAAHDPAPTALGRIGRYRVERQLGQGGMGAVMLVRDEEIGRSMAAKVLLRRFLVPPQELHRFLLEAKITGQLEHPGIVPVHELGLTEEDQPYFTMKRVEGQTLGQLLDQARQEPPPLLELLNIFLKICDAIAFAHNRGVIHRDLKPANVMVGRYGEVQVVDWGLAKVLPDEALGDRVGVDLASGSVKESALAGVPAEELGTLCGAVLGTPGYMSPEQAEGRLEEVEQRTDIYALGALLYTMVTLRPPYDYGSSALEVLQSTIRGDLIPPTARAPERTIPWELEAVTLKAMALQPAHRYPSVEALRGDLVRFLEGQTLSAATYNPWQVLAKWVARHRAAVAAGLFAVLLAGAVGAWSGWRAWTTRRAVDRLRVRAEMAFSRGAWSEALGLCQRGAALGEDLTLERLAHQCRLEIGREKARASEAYSRGQLQRKLRPIARRIDETRPFFYIAKVDLRAKLAELAAALRSLEELTADPRYARYVDPWRLLGSGWYFVGDLRRAEGVLLEALKRAPDDPVANFYLGRICLQRGAAELTHTLGRKKQRELTARWTRKALACFERAGNRFGNRALDRHLSRGYLMVASGKKARLAAHCKEGLARFAGKLGAEEYWHLLCWVSDRQAVFGHIEKALEMRPHYAWLRFLRGSAHDGMGRARQARADYDAAIRINPFLAEAWLNRGMLKLRMGDREGARADLDEGIRLEPDVAQNYATRAQLLTETGDLRGALADLARAIALAPRSAWLHGERAKVHFERGDYAAAEKDYRETARLDPDDWMAWMNLAIVHHRLGREKEAFAEIDRAIAGSVDEPDAYLVRARFHASSGKPERARADLDRALAVAPKHVDSWLERGALRFGAGDLAGALADFEQGLALDPKSAVAHLKRGAVMQATGRIEDALRDYGRAIALDPKLVDAYANRSVLRLMKRDLTGALSDASLASRLAPDNTTARVNHGLVLLELGRPKAALREFDHVIRIAPGKPHPYFCRAQVHMSMGKLAAAEADYLRAAEIAPASWRPRYGYGAVLLARGKRAEGLAALRRALELAPPAVKPALTKEIERLKKRK